MSNNTKNKRWLVLDALKALIVAIMIFGHTLIWWYSHGSDKSMIILDNIYYQPILFGLFPLFSALVMSLPLTAGMALYFSLNSRKKLTEKHFLQWCFLRSGIILLLGFLVNLLAWGWRYIWTWDVLPFYALCCLIISLLVRYVSQWSLIFVALLSIILTKTGPLFSLPEYAHIILWGDKSGDHFWPLFPWISIVIIGFFISYLYQQKYHLFTKGLFTLGGSAIVMSLISGNFLYETNLQDIWGSGFFHPTLSTINMQVGIMLILIALLESYLKNKELLPNSIIKSYSQGILFIYIANITLGFHLTLLLQSKSWLMTLLWPAVFIQLIVAYYIGKNTYLIKNKFRTTKN